MKVEIGDLITVYNYVNETSPSQYTVLEIVDDEWLKVTHPEISGCFTVRTENVLEVLDESR